METIKEVVIEIPEGHVIDEEKSTFTKIVFKKIQKMLPKTWKELGRVKGYYVTSGSHINVCDSFCNSSDQNTLPTEKLAEAMLALCQLLYLRDVYNDGWVADWNDTTAKYCIEIYRNRIIMDIHSCVQKVLHFKTLQLRDEFYNNFKDLIEIAKPLI